MLSISVDGWIAVTKSGRVARRKLVRVDGESTLAPKVTIGMPPLGEPYVKRVRVTIEELPSPSKEARS